MSKSVPYLRVLLSAAFLIFLSAHADTGTPDVPAAALSNPPAGGSSRVRFCAQARTADLLCASEARRQDRRFHAGKCLFHSIDPQRLRREIEAAGFLFDAQSSVLRNPSDDHKSLKASVGFIGRLTKADQVAAIGASPGAMRFPGLARILLS